ncbi:hypothetical protein [Rubripirellula amarantea]|nr:hypothetical protein [Rubripirellula amarantea]
MHCSYSRQSTLFLCQVVAFLGHFTLVSVPGVSMPSVWAQDVGDQGIGAQGVADPSSESPPPVASISFVQSKFENVREGYQALQWNEIDGAARYEVINAEGVSYYDGAQAEAFISGLPDGRHVFDVQAFSDDDVLMGASQSPAVIDVEHWSMTQAWVSFGVGLAVFISLIGTIAWGSLRSLRVGEPRSVSQSEPNS